MALAMIFQEFRQTRLRNAKMRRAEALPKLFAASKRAGIISAGLMTNEILLARFFPRFCGFALLHVATVERHREKHKQNLLLFFGTIFAT